MKKLLLGSAAAMLLGGAAQAADLSVAEPIDYVRVCDAFGNTYWYSPGTDTCLSITGYVRLDTRIAAGVAGATATSAAGNWLFNTKAALTVQARSMTEWGPLVGFMRMAGQSNNSAVGPGGTPAGAASPIHNVALEEYYGSLGNLLFGYTESTYQYGYNVPHFRVINNFGQLRLGNVDQVRFGFAAGGWGIAVAAEDPRDMALATNVATMAFPDIAARLTGSMGIVSAQLSAAYGARAVYNTWGVQLGANVDLSQIAAGDALKVAFALGNSPERVSGALADAGPGTYWTAQASFVHVLNAQWAAAVYGSYSRSGPAANAAWQASFIAQFTPVTNFTISGELAYVVAQGAAAGALNGTVRFQRSF